MQNTIKVAVIISLIAILPSCKPKDNVCVAGAGGSVTIVAYPRHHGKSVRPYQAWVKYNTKDAPGNTAASYDLVKNADTTEDHIELINLKCGDYYIYMHGYDTSILDPVKGAIPYTLAESATGEVSIEVPVSE